MASFERMGWGDRHGLLPYQTASPNFAMEPLCLSGRNRESPPDFQGSPIRLDGGCQRREGQIRKFVQATARSERVHVSSRSLRHTHAHASRWLLIRRAAAEHANRRTAAERTGAVPDRTCVRRSNRLVQEAPERLTSATAD